MGRGIARLVSLAVLLAVAITAYLLTGMASPSRYGASGTTGEDSSSTTAGGGVLAPDRASASPAIAITPIDAYQSLYSEFEAGLAARPRNPAALRQLLDELTRLDPPLAAGGYERLAAAYPRNAPVWAGLGRALRAMGEAAEARSAVARALRLDAECAEARLLRGVLLAEGEPPSLDAAVSEWSRVIELAPGTTVAREASEYLAIYEGR